MLSPAEREFVAESLHTNKFGMISHAVALARTLNFHILSQHGRTISPNDIFEAMQEADHDVNQYIRQVKGVPGEVEEDQQG